MLSLDDNPVGDTGATAIAELLGHNSCLRMLSLTGTHITAAGATALADAAARHPGALTYLSLQGCQLQDSGAAAVARLLATEPLAVLDLEDTGMQAAGVASVAAAMATSTSLRSCFLARNDMGSAGLQAVARAMVHNLSVVHMSVRSSTRNTDSMRASMAAIMAKCAHNAELQIHQQSMLVLAVAARRQPRRPHLPTELWRLTLDEFFVSSSIVARLLQE